MNLNKMTKEELETLSFTDMAEMILKEQKAIADILTNMYNEIVTLGKKLINYRQVKQGMMQQLLTGKIRIT